MVPQTRTHKPASRQRAQAARVRPCAPGAPQKALEVLSLSALINRCIAESEHFYAGRTHDPRFSYELFRRALAERNESAWTELFAHYRPLVESWVRRSTSFNATGETSDYFVSAAFTRFWRAIPPERFVNFPSLASLLQYLQMCAGCVVIDSARSATWSRVVPEEAMEHHATQGASDNTAMERIEREEFWRTVEGLLHGEAERVVVGASFLMGMKPADIHEQRPDLFESVQAVYTIKRNVLNRLSRSQELRRQLV